MRSCFTLAHLLQRKTVITASGFKAAERALTDHSPAAKRELSIYFFFIIEENYMITIHLNIVENGTELSLNHLAELFSEKVAGVLYDQLIKTSPTGRAEGALPTHKESESRTPKAVNITEGARLLGISPVTLRLYAANGKIRVVRIGRRILVPMESIEKVLKEGVTNHR
jgi:excisionase family DNA binding protein